MTSAQGSFSFDESLAEWNIPAKNYLVDHHKDDEWDGIATANLVFNPHGKVLIIQRASTDSMPNKWEVPGGAVDADDATILSGAARELLEESGLVAKQFTHVVTGGPGQAPGQTFQNRTKTKHFCRFAFHVEVESCEHVTLDPQEHQDYVWASEEEIRAQRLGERDLPITHESMAALILEGFRLRLARSP